MLCRLYPFTLGCYKRKFGGLHGSCTCWYEGRTRTKGQWWANSCSTCGRKRSSASFQYPCTFLLSFLYTYKNYPFYPPEKFYCMPLFSLLIRNCIKNDRIESQYLFPIRCSPILNLVLQIFVQCVLVLNFSTPNRNISLLAV